MFMYLGLIIYILQISPSSLSDLLSIRVALISGRVQHWISMCS